MSAISGENGNYSYEQKKIDNGTQKAIWSIDVNDTSTINNNTWTVADCTTRTKLGVDVSEIEGVVNAYTASCLHDEIDFEIQRPEFEIYIQEKGALINQKNKTIKGGDTVNLHADLKIGNKEIQNLTWECKGPQGDNLISNYVSPQNGNDRVFKIPEYTLKEDDNSFLGTYTIRVSYNSPRKDYVYADEYTIYVNERDAHLSIADNKNNTSSTIKKSENVYLTANLSVDGYEPYSYTVNWSCENTGKQPVNNALSNTTGKEVNFSADNLSEGIYTVTAAYTYKGMNNEVKTVTSNSYEITVQE